MEPAVGSFEYLNQQWTGPAGVSATHENLRQPGEFPPKGFPDYVAVQLPRYEVYPGGAPLPYLYIGFIVFSGVYAVWSAAKDHYWLPRVPKSVVWLFDVALAAALVSLLADTIVTVSQTYEHYGTIHGIEGNGFVRQWAAWSSENLSINFAWALALQDILEGTVIILNWYYGRKERNLSALFLILVSVYEHGYTGWSSWKKSIAETLRMIPGVLKQLGGVSRKYQGGGPQVVIGVV